MDIDTKVRKIRGIDESKVRQGRLHAGTGKFESTASWSQYARPGGELKDLENGPQPQRKPPIEAAQIMNECDMCSERCQGVPTAACRFATAVVGGIFLVHAGGRNGDQVGGQTRLGQLSSLGSKLSLVCQTALALWLDEGDPQRLIQQKPYPPASLSDAHRHSRPARSNRRASLAFSDTSNFCKAEENFETENGGRL